MSLHQLSLPLGDYRGFINEQGVLFHTSYQTDHKTPSLGFDCLVTDVGAALYGNAVGLAECLHQRGRMSDLTGVFFFRKWDSAPCEQLDLPSHRPTHGSSNWRETV